MKWEIEMLDKTIETLGAAFVVLLGVLLAHQDKHWLTRWGIAVMSVTAGVLLGDTIADAAGYPPVAGQIVVGSIAWPGFDLVQSLLADRQKMLAFIWSKLGVKK